MTQQNTNPETMTTEATEQNIDGRTKRALDTAIAKKQVSQESYRAVLEGRIDLKAAKDLGRDGSPFGPTPKTVSKNDRTRLCMCQCGRETRGRFATGHDARVKGWIVRAVREGTLDELSEEIQEYAAERNLIRQTRERMAAEEAKRQEKAAKQAAAKKAEAEAKKADAEK